MSNKLVVHMIGNAHLDPVWLWSWQEGVDEVLATAYTTINLLKEYPEFIFTRSDVWFHKIIERINPELFNQIQKFVAEDRWFLVGGWYVQPDCNLPTEYGFRKHIETGKKYFREKFGKEIKIGYNVDSFGHAGSLPKILRNAGYQAYIYMRPGKHEKDYPIDSHLFLWEASDTTDRIVTYRIPTAYGNWLDNLEDHIKSTIDNSDTSLGHIMCFYGVGDHGGGPTRKHIEYIIENKNKFDNIELRFSHPGMYFQAIADKLDKLPIIKGELQHHAVGCYTVLHPLKKETKSAEHRLSLAEKIVSRFPQHSSPSDLDLINTSWEDVLFAQFHDTLGGTCIKSAYPDIFRQIGRAHANAEDIILNTTRRLCKELPTVKVNDKLIKSIGVFNPHDEEYTYWCEQTLFSNNLAREKGTPIRLIDLGTKEQIPANLIRAESTTTSTESILFPIHLKPGEVKILNLESVESNAQSDIETDLKVDGKTISSSHWKITPSESEITFISSALSAKLEWCIYEDPTDTWSHNVFSLGENLLGKFKQSKVLIEENLPLRTTLTWFATYNHSTLRVRVKLYKHEKWAEILITVWWNEPMSILKMNFTPTYEIVEKLDGIPAGAQKRPLDSKEYPFADWTLLTHNNNAHSAIVSPDIFGFDASQNYLRFTLLRNPVYAHHHPAAVDEENKFIYDFTDVGEHSFKVYLNLDENILQDNLVKFANQLNQPIIMWDHPYKTIAGGSD